MDERVVLIFVGILLFLVGFFKAAWNMYSWGKMVEVGQRPAVYPDGSSRVGFWVEVVVAAVGATLVVFSVGM